MNAKPSMFALPKAPPRTPVAENAADAFVSDERPSAIVEAVTSAAPVTPVTPVTPVARRRRAPKPVAAPVDENTGARLSVDVSPATMRRLKIRAIEQGTTVRAYVLALLARDGL